MSPDTTDWCQRMSSHLSANPRILASHRCHEKRTAPPKRKIRKLREALRTTCSETGEVRSSTNPSRVHRDQSQAQHPRHTLPSRIVPVTSLASNLSWGRGLIWRRPTLVRHITHPATSPAGGAAGKHRRQGGGEETHEQGAPKARRIPR